MRRPPKPPAEDRAQEPIEARDKLETAVNPPAADEFWSNLLRILDEIEAERNDGPQEKGSRGAA